MPLRQATAHATAAAIAACHDAWAQDFRHVTQQAARRFAARDWAAVRRDAGARVALYRRWTDEAVAGVGRRLGAARRDRALWAGVRDAYAAQVAGRADVEIAESFYNSVTRRVFGTVGVAADVELLRTVGGDVELAPPELAEAAGALRPLDVGGGPEGLARAALAGWRPPRAGPGQAPARWADLDGDATRVGAALAAGARAALGGWPDGAALLDATFYRNKGAYLVGRLWRGAAGCPLVIALVHGPEGLAVDAVLTSEDDASVVFGFAWSAFHVDVADAVGAHPRALVALLAALLPAKRIDELYTALGYHKHAKTELYRTLLDHLARPGARFERAPGTPGLVMECVTLRSLNVVFKLIRDRFGPPKRTTRRQVMERYQYVFGRDRVGRLCDAQEFEGLTVPRACVPDPLLAALQATAPSIVQAGDAHVVLGHCYTERRLAPLDLYVRGVDVDAAVAAIDDWGQALRDLAAAGIFPGDLLLKNFGVSRHGRVVFYDYDELADLAECRFHALPDDDDESSMSAAHAAGDHDVFPEEFARFTLPVGPLRDAFLARHRDLLDPGWWEDVQRRVAAGELVDVFPYPQARRLRR